MGIMIKGGEVRKADFPIEPLILDRWSPRAMSGEEISTAELMRLFEAARWAPSSFNNQQWRLVRPPRTWRQGSATRRTAAKGNPNDRRKVSESVCDEPFAFRSPSLLGRPRRSALTSDSDL
jgi:hypothetical protein